LGASAGSPLKQWRRTQREERLRAGSGWLADHVLAGEKQPNSFVFTCTNGQPVHPATIRSWFKRLVGESKLPRHKVHGLRHTHAAVLLNNGRPLEKVSRRLGHATTGVTDMYYRHLVRDGRPGASPISFREVITAERGFGGSWVGATGSEDPSAT
jgi:integrase